LDLLSAEYGWGTEYILTRTMHEIRWRLDRLTNRLNQRVELDAKMHGLEVTTPKPAQESQVSADQQAAMDAALEETKQRKAAEYGNR